MARQLENAQRMRLAELVYERSKRAKRTHMTLERKSEDHRSGGFVPRPPMYTRSELKLLAEGRGLVARMARGNLTVCWYKGRVAEIKALVNKPAGEESPHASFVEGFMRRQIEKGLC